MAGPFRVTGPDGKAWTVRRRWYPWRRRSLCARSGTAAPSGNPFLNAILGIIGVILWIVITAGKVVLILLAGPWS
jgi:hypothetical protein